ncbi:MAG: hypothetical protein U0V73_11605 [Acidimicrobiia bacterium]
MNAAALEQDRRSKFGVAAAATVVAAGAAIVASILWVLALSSRPETLLGTNALSHASTLGWRERIDLFTRSATGWWPVAALLGAVALAVFLVPSNRRRTLTLRGGMMLSVVVFASAVWGGFEYALKDAGTKGQSSLPSSLGPFRVANTSQRVEGVLSVLAIAVLAVLTIWLANRELAREVVVDAGADETDVSLRSG